MSDFLTIDGVLGDELLARVLEELRVTRGEPAPASDVPSARRAVRIHASPGTCTPVLEAFERHRSRIADHFGRVLDEVEEPQFLRYRAGDYFVPHQDGNTPVLHDHTRFRKVSAVIFLSDPAGHEGGSLVLHGAAPVTVTPTPGTLVAFPAETTHEVTPLTAGERFSAVAWYRATA